MQRSKLHPFPYFKSPLPSLYTLAAIPAFSHPIFHCSIEKHTAVRACAGHAVVVGQCKKRANMGEENFLKYGV